MPYVIAGLASLAFIILWFYTVNCELNELKKSVDSSALQIKLNRDMKSHAKYAQEIKQAEKMLIISLTIYYETANKYNITMHRPFYRVPALLLGFKKIAEHI